MIQIHYQKQSEPLKIVIFKGCFLGISKKGENLSRLTVSEMKRRLDPSGDEAILSSCTERDVCFVDQHQQI